MPKSPLFHDFYKIKIMLYGIFSCLLLLLLHLHFLVLFGFFLSFFYNVKKRKNDRLGKHNNCRKILKRFFSCFSFVLLDNKFLILVYYRSTLSHIYSCPICYMNTFNSPSSFLATNQTASDK